MVILDFYVSVPSQTVSFKSRSHPLFIYEFPESSRVHKMSSVNMCGVNWRKKNDLLWKQSMQHLMPSPHHSSQEISASKKGDNKKILGEMVSRTAKFKWADNNWNSICKENTLLNTVTWIPMNATASLSRVLRFQLESPGSASKAEPSPTGIQMFAYFIISDTETSFLPRISGQSHSINYSSASLN